MLSSRLHTAFFDLLRSGLWGKRSVMALDNISSEDWAEIYNESVKQTVSGLIYDGIVNAEHDSLPDNDLIAKWTVRVVRIANYNAKVNKTISTLAKPLNSRGIAPILLKGQATAMLYNEPTLRESGDIDFFFQDEKALATACEIVGKGGMTERKSDGSYVCNRNGVTVELHSKMFDMVSSSQRKHLSEAVSALGFRRMDWTEDPSVEILKPTPVLNMLMQNLHILRHALSFGIGLRQLCDYAVCHRDLNDSEIISLSRILDKMGLCRWNNMLMSFLDTYLYGNAKSISPCTLYKLVMQTGNFGFGAESRSWNRVVANNIRLFPTVPVQSLTTVLSLLARR